MSKVRVHDGSSVIFWQDLWNGQVTAQAFPELFSFAKDPWISYRNMLQLSSPSQHFHLPLSIQAHQQLITLWSSFPEEQSQLENDIWIYNWGNANFSTGKAYKVMMGHGAIHPAFRWV